MKIAALITFSLLALAVIFLFAHHGGDDFTNKIVIHKLGERTLDIPEASQEVYLSQRSHLPVPASQEDDILEAAVRYQIIHHPLTYPDAPDNNLYYIERDFNHTVVSDELINRFSGEKIRVKNASSTISNNPDGTHSNIPHEPGVILSVDLYMDTAAQAEVDIEDTHQVDSEEYTVVKSRFDGKWKVISETPLAVY